MAKRKLLRVSWHNPSNQFVKWIGKSRGKDGSVRPKVHYLGSDRCAALSKATALKAEWNALKLLGAHVWPARDWHAHWCSLGQPSGTMPTVGRSTLTLAQAVKDYDDWLVTRCQARQITPQYRESVRYMLARTEQQMRSKTLLADISEQHLSSCVLVFASRPSSNGSTTPCPISITYAKKLVSTTKTFFEWLYDTGRWNERPRNFNRLFRFKPVLTVQELEGLLDQGRAEPDHLSLDDLSQLYSSACARHRLWMLLSLNCGFAQAELDSLRLFEVRNIAGAQPFIERFRQKTSVYGRWSLWPETAHLLRQYMAEPNEDQIALFTERGKRLKSIAPSGVFSGVSEAWRNIVNRSGVSKGSYKLLRKTGARMTKDIGGIEASEMYLAHQEPGTNKAYAGRRWDKLDAALDEMRNRLMPMFNAGKHCGASRFQQSAYNESNGLLPFPPPKRIRSATPDAQ